MDVRGVESSRDGQRRTCGGGETSSCRGSGKSEFGCFVIPDLVLLLVQNVLTQEAAIEVENVIRKHGSTRLKADFKAFNLAINPRLEALLYSGDRLASLTNSPLLPSQLSLQLVNLSYQVTSLKGD